MKRTTVKIPDELDAKLRHEAARRGITISELTREALETFVGRGGRRRRIVGAGFGDSGHVDGSERMEELLGEIISKDYERQLAEYRAGVPPVHAA